MPDEQKEMLVVVQQTGLQADTAKNLQDSFAPLFRNARGILEKSRAITVTDASQKLEIKLARECRLALRSIRVEGDKTRKALKEDSLRRGKAIDGFYNILLHLTEAEEARLDEQEKFVERQEAARKAQLKLDREKALQPFGVDTAFMSLGEMSDEAFAQLLDNSRIAHEAKQAELRRVEEERIRLENERLKEAARIREENERLRREAAEREEAATKERERIKAEIEKENQRKIAEMERRKSLHVSRLNKLSGFLTVEEINATPVFFYSDMMDDQFLVVLSEKQKQADERDRLRREAEAREAAQKAERERLEALAAAERQKAAEAAEQARIEKERIEAENAAKLTAERKKAEAAQRAAAEKARKEREAAEAKAKAEREALERKAAEERAAREKLEAEAKAAREESERKAAAEAEQKRQAALAPDKEKLLAVAGVLRSIPIPGLSTKEGQAAGAVLRSKLEKLAQWVEQEAALL